MKNSIKYILQKILGFQNYLKVFSVFKIMTIKGDHKENDFFHFLSLLPDDGLVIDAGANIGIMTYHLSKKMKSGQVLSIEPMPDNLKTLRSIKKWFSLDNVTIAPIAIGSETGEVEMLLPLTNGKVKEQGLSHIASIKEEPGIKFKVPLKKMDNLPQLKSAKVVGIKIDVENYEYNALLGAKTLLQKDKPIIYCELWENENRYNCFELVKSLGYAIKVFDGEKLIPFEAKLHKQQNFFFV